jgi:hypothetical protein
MFLVYSFHFPQTKPSIPSFNIARFSLQFILQCLDYVGHAFSTTRNGISRDLNCTKRYPNQEVEYEEPMGDAQGCQVPVYGDRTSLWESRFSHTASRCLMLAAASAAPQRLTSGKISTQMPGWPCRTCSVGEFEVFPGGGLSRLRFLSAPSVV